MLLSAGVVCWAGSGAAQDVANPAGSDSFSSNSSASQMADYYELIFQIRVVARNAGSKSSIGSGFQVSADGLVVTNYHVVAMAVESPETHRIEYLDQAGGSGELLLLDFDVVNDLALLRHPNPAARHFEVDAAADTRQSVDKGEMIYALGNPHDLGITLKLGAFNGMVEHSFNSQILFSGSLNPGMSGGPGLLASGKVIGVNVATAGSDLSFLVPASAVTRLIDADRSLASESYPTEIAMQLKNWQSARYEDLLARDWQAVEFGDWLALDEIRVDMQCWGSSNEDEDDLAVVALSKGCDAGNQLYLGDGFSTGHIHYSFSQRRSKELSPLRFHATTSNSMYPDNAGDDSKLTGFECNSGFVNVASNQAEGAQASAGSVTTSLCVRAYVELPGIFDVLLLATQSTNLESYTAHFALAGVPRELADRFTRSSSLVWAGTSMSSTSLVLVVRDGAGQRYERSELNAGESILVGRSWQCDIIIQDPQVDPEHVEVGLSAEGRLTCIDLNSLNGVLTFESPTGNRLGISAEPKPVRLVPAVPQTVSSGATLRMGKSQVIVYEADHEVAPAVEPSRWDAYRQLFEKPLWVALGLVALSVTALLVRLAESVEPLSAEMIVSVLSWETVGLGVWVLFWGLLTKLWRDTMHLRAHLSIAAFSGAAGYLLAQLSDLVGWQLQSVNVESLLFTFGMAALLFVVLLLTLGVATRLRGRAILWVACVPGLLLLLSVYVTPLLGDEEVEWFPQLVTSSYPPGWQLDQGEALDSFISASPGLYDTTSRLAADRALELAEE